MGNAMGCIPKTKPAAPLKQLLRHIYPKGLR